MQAKLERGKAAFRMRGVGLSVAILLASATLSLSAPDRALAACGGASHPAHAAATGNGGTHVATSTVATSGGSGGGGGSLGCAGGASGSALRGLPLASSGRVVEPGAGAHAARTETHARNATTRTPGATAHLHAVGHHA
jgi:hypothetical protein